MLLSFVFIFSVNPLSIQIRKFLSFYILRSSCELQLFVPCKLGIYIPDFCKFILFANSNYCNSILLNINACSYTPRINHFCSGVKILSFFGTTEKCRGNFSPFSPSTSVDTSSGDSIFKSEVWKYKTFLCF